MFIDIGVAVTILMFALLGLASGFWGQILRLIALGSLYFVAPPVARVLEEPVADILEAGTNPSMIKGVALIVAAIGLYLVMSLIIGLILRAARRGREMSGANRFGGFLLGTLKGAALTYLLLCGFVMVAHEKDYSPALGQSGRLVEQASESRLVTFVGEHNLLEEMGYELPSPQQVAETLGELAPQSLQQLGAEGTGAAVSEPAVPGTAPPAETAQPGMAQPGMVQPGMVQPGMVQPGMVQPGMVQPGMVQPGAPPDK